MGWHLHGTLPETQGPMSLEVVFGGRHSPLMWYGTCGFRSDDFPVEVVVLGGGRRWWYWVDRILHSGMSAYCRVPCGPMVLLVKYDPHLCSPAGHWPLALWPTSHAVHGLLNVESCTSTNTGRDHPHMWRKVLDIVCECLCVWPWSMWRCKCEGWLAELVSQ